MKYISKCLSLILLSLVLLNSAYAEEDKVHKKTGKKPVILEGVQTVNAGVDRIMKLQEQGYAYIRP